jgi:hypothetical protein
VLDLGDSILIAGVLCAQSLKSPQALPKQRTLVSSSEILTQGSPLMVACADVSPTAFQPERMLHTSLMTMFSALLASPVLGSPLPRSAAACASGWSTILKSSPASQPACRGMEDEVHHSTGLGVSWDSCRATAGRTHSFQYRSHSRCQSLCIARAVSNICTRLSNAIGTNDGSRTSQGPARR